MLVPSISRANIEKRFKLPYEASECVLTRMPPSGHVTTPSVCVECGCTLAYFAFY